MCVNPKSSVLKHLFRFKTNKIIFSVKIIIIPPHKLDTLKHDY